MQKKSKSALGWATFFSMAGAMAETLFDGLPLGRITTSFTH